MARQSGVIKLEGKVGDLSFYKTKDGYLARTKGGVSKERIQTDPAFQRTRENGAEFGRAGVGGRLLRTAFRPLLMRSSDNKMAGRLTQLMVKVVKADAENARGERVVDKGDLAMLQGFDFNVRARLSATLFGKFNSGIDRETGAASVTIEAFRPNESLAIPQGATHLRFVAGTAPINFPEESFELNMANSAEVEINSEVQAEITLATTFPAASEMPIFLLMGIEFFQSVNGVFYPLKNGAHNTLNLVLVDTGLPK